MEQGRERQVSSDRADMELNATCSGGDEEEERPPGPEEGHLGEGTHGPLLKPHTQLFFA